MQLTISINQAFAIDWGLNPQQALLFAFVYTVPSWANPVETQDGVFYALSKQKITEELPILTDKPDTAYRLLRQLEKSGLVELSSTSKITLVRLTEKAMSWNKKTDGTPIRRGAKQARKNIRANHGNKSEVGNKSDVGRKNIRAEIGKISELRSEKNPTNQYTNNQSTNNQDTSNTLAQAADATLPAVGELVPADDPVQPKVEIPTDMPGPKDPKAKTFKTWANYAMTYRRRYGVWPVWNARVAGQLGNLIDRIGHDAAPKVAAYYLSISDQRFITEQHSVGLLLSRCEALHTQWATGTRVNGTTARQQERTAANFEAAQTVIKKIMTDDQPVGSQQAEGSIYDNPFWK